MFKYWAENITHILMKKRILDIENRDTYVYALEAILLNGCILITMIVVSVFSKNWQSLLGLFMFFVPLRSMAGGYHAKTSECCYVLTLVIYVTVMYVSEKISNIANDGRFIVLFLFFICFIIVVAPVKSKIHPLSKIQYNRNRYMLYTKTSHT